MQDFDQQAKKVSLSKELSTYGCVPDAIAKTAYFYAILKAADRKKPRYIGS